MSTNGAEKWTTEQDNALRQAVKIYEGKDWRAVAEQVPGRTHSQCLQRWNNVLKPGLTKGHWSVEEDNLLVHNVVKGCRSWRQVADSIPGRSAKQCRERWRKHLDPSIQKTPFTEAEDSVLSKCFAKWGNRWTRIAKLLPGRTEDAVKARCRILFPKSKQQAKRGRPPTGTAIDMTGILEPLPPQPKLLTFASHPVLPSVGDPGSLFPYGAFGPTSSIATSTTTTDSIGTATLAFQSGSIPSDFHLPVLSCDPTPLYTPYTSMGW